MDGWSLIVFSLAVDSSLTHTLKHLCLFITSKISVLTILQNKCYLWLNQHQAKLQYRKIFSSIIHQDKQLICFMYSDSCHNHGRSLCSCQSISHSNELIEGSKRKKMLRAFNVGLNPRQYLQNVRLCLCGKEFRRKCTFVGTNKNLMRLVVFRGAFHSALCRLNTIELQQNLDRGVEGPIAATVTQLLFISNSQRGPLLFKNNKEKAI